MRYLKTLFVVLFAFLSSSTFAADEAKLGSWIDTSGQFYLYNVSKQAYLCGGGSWSTHAWLESVPGNLIQLEAVNGSYRIKTFSKGNANNCLGLDGTDPWMDKNPNNYDCLFTFTEVEVEGFNVGYVISHTRGNLGTPSDASDFKVLFGQAEAQSTWVLISPDDLNARLQGVIPSDGIDATFLIKNPGLANQTQYGDGFWNNGWSLTDVGNKTQWGPNATGGTNNTGVPNEQAAEIWDGTFTLKQTISNMPNGRYGLSVYGYERVAGNGSRTDVDAYFFAGSSQQTLNPISAGDPTINYLGDAEKAFMAGKYQNGPIKFDVTTGSVTIGAANPKNTDADWVVLNNFQLTYFGNAPLLKELIDKANELMPTLNETNAKELQKAIDDAQKVLDNESSTTSQIEAAMEALQAAYNTADAENIAKRNAIEVLNNVPYVLFPKNFKWALEDGEKYSKLTAEEKMDINRAFKVYKNNNGKYQLASRIAVAALVKLLEYADADEKTKKAIKARLEELGVEGYDEMLADAITTYTRLVVESHGVGAALGEQGDPNYSRMYAALEEAGESNIDDYLDVLLYGSTTHYILEDPDPWYGGGTYTDNSWTSADGLVTITNLNGEITFPYAHWGYTDYVWGVAAGEDWQIKVNSDDEKLNLDELHFYYYYDWTGTVNGLPAPNSYYELSGKEAIIHIDEVGEDPYMYFYLYLKQELDDPWEVAGVEKTTSDIYEMLHQYFDGYRYGYDANFTAHIKDPNLTEGGDAWESTWGGILSGEPLTDSQGSQEYPYFDANTWNESGTMEVDAHQTIQLPPGRYMLTAAGRASEYKRLSDTATRPEGSAWPWHDKGYRAGNVWETAFTEAGAQDPSNYFQLYATTFQGTTTSQSFLDLEGNKGGIFDNGWNDASVFFTMPSVGDVTIGVRAATNVKERWASATRFRLTRLGDATVYLNEDETLTDELNWDVVGYNLGAYAPTDFLLKKEMQAGKWYSIAVPCDLPADQIIREFGEGTLLAQPLGVLDLDAEGKQKLLGFLEWDPNETSAMYGMGGDHVYGNSVDGILANTPYLIKPATVKASNRYLFKDIFAVEKKSVEKSEWSWGAVSVSDVDNDWGFWSSDYGPIKFYPNYTYKPGYADGYTVEVCDTVKAYTGLFEVEGDAEIGTILMLTLDEEYNLYLADDATAIPEQQILDLVALGQQKAEWYPGIPAAMANKLTTVPELDDYVTTLISAINSLKTAITEAQKAYEPSKKFNALMAEAEKLLNSDHTELVAGADAAFKKKIEQLQKRFDMQLKADPIYDLIESLEAAIAEYKDQIYTGIIETGRHILQNVATGKFFGGANSWGTRSSLVDHPEYMLLTKLDDGDYTLESRQNNGGEQFYFGPNYFVDNGTPMHLTFTLVGKGIYTITCTGEGGTGLLGYDGSTTVLSGTLTEATEDAQWLILSEKDLAGMMAEASLENPVDATFFIKDANFSRNHRDADAWVWETENHNIAGDNTNFCAESWTHTFVLSQELELPNGVYMLNAQAALTDYTNAYDKRDDYPVVFAGDETVKFCEMEEADRATSMTQLSNSFSAGKYFVDPVIVEVTDGKLTIGAKCDATDYWCIFDNFSLTYFADADIDAVRAAYPKNTGATTGINEVNTGVNTGAIYNLNGVRVNNMTKKGVYIVNGKKVVVK